MFVKDLYSFKEMFTSFFLGGQMKNMCKSRMELAVVFFRTGVQYSSSEWMIFNGNLGRIWDRVAIFQHSLEKGSGKYVQKH